MVGRVFLGRYQALRLLGEGGMGRVFLARQLDNGKSVVVKVLHEHIASQPKVRDSFKQEMLFMSRFRHPNVVTLLDASSDGPEGPCIIMEYIPGSTLDGVLARARRLAPDRAGRLLAQMCLALHAAHTVGIIHRDLKPANLMVMNPFTPNETLKVMDFGLAKLGTALYLPVERLANPEQYYGACGTPEYICPEQVRGDEMDHRGDLYSVGVILYEMLCGRVPFDKGDVAKTMLAHGNDKPPRFAEVGVAGAIPYAIEEVVRSCLAKYPVERPQTAHELLQRYEKALGRKLVTPDQYAEAPARTVEAPPSPAKANRADPNAIVHQLDAWMPERIAVVKLKGFVDDLGGQVVESVPGLIRVRLPIRPPDRARSQNGLFTRLGFAKKEEAPPPLDVDLHMEKKNGTGALNQLHITVIMHPVNRAQANDPAWHHRCDEIQRDLKAYLMGRG